MVLSKITDIIQWLRGREEKTVSIKLDRSCRQWGIFCSLSRNAPIKFDLHVEELVLKDVTLKIARHTYGHGCGSEVIGYADGKPVVEGQHVPHRALAEPLVYMRGSGRYYLGDASHARTVTCLKYLWLMPNAQSVGIE